MDYSGSVGIFSPDGRLYQVEYAQNASRQGSAVCLNIFNNKIMIFYEVRTPNKLHIPSEKIFKVKDNIFMLYSGIRPDSYIVTNQASKIIANYQFFTSEDISLSIFAGKIAGFIQKSTVQNDTRPFGLKTVVFGFEDGIAKIFTIEADGNYAEYYKCGVGYKSETVIKYLLENDGELAALNGLLEIVQKDDKKIKGFSLSLESGLEMVDNEIIKKTIKDLN